MSPIFVARDARSVEKLDETVPERVFTRPESVVTSVFVFVILPERFAVIFCSTVLILHERELMFPERVLTFPESEERFELVFARFPERVVIVLFIPLTVPLMAFCARESVK